MKPAQKAASTRRARFDALSPGRKAHATRKRKAAARKAAAKKDAATRSAAGRKAAVTRRSKKSARRREEFSVVSMTKAAKAFFDACDTGKGWVGCKAYCKPDATFAAQAEPLADVRTLQQYADWMKGMMSVLPDGRYKVKSFAVDAERNNVCAYGVFYGTHTGQGGPVPPTGKKTDTDYVYVMEFDGDKIRHMTKIWHAGWAMKELGWAG